MEVVARACGCPRDGHVALALSAPALQGGAPVRAWVAARLASHASFFLVLCAATLGAAGGGGADATAMDEGGEGGEAGDLGGGSGLNRVVQAPGRCLLWSLGGSGRETSAAHLSTIADFAGIPRGSALSDLRRAALALDRS